MSEVSGPSHSVYRVISGEYDDTPCWCAATWNHLVGEEVVATHTTDQAWPCSHCRSRDHNTGWHDHTKGSRV